MKRILLPALPALVLLAACASEPTWTKPGLTEADLSDAECVLFVVGPGNNGGDALVAARQLAGTDRELVLWAPLGKPDRAETPALQALEAAEAIGLTVATGPLPECAADLVVDGLFGVGLGRPLEGRAREAVEQLAALRRPILAVDLPSGLDGDTGEVHGVALAATWTLTFVAPKAGFYLGEGPRLTGSLAVAPIGVSPAYAADWLSRERTG